MRHKKNPSHDIERRRQEVFIRVLDVFGMTPEELAEESDRMRRKANPARTMSPDLHNALWLGSRLN